MSVRPTLVVGQSGGPTAVINRSLAGVIEEATASSDRVGRVLGLRFGIEGLLAEEFVDLGRQSSQSLVELSETPSSALGSSRYMLRDADIAPALASLRKLDARYFIYIGGNDSADTTHRIAQAATAGGYDLRCIGVPKTVDNDLTETDHCPGYGSAARFLALTLMELSRDTEAMRRTDPVKIVEVAGRHAGWLAAASALGRRSEVEGPHLVLLPERPCSVEKILADVERAYRAFGHVVAVLSENQPDEKGHVLGSGDEPEYLDKFGHAYFPSPAAFLVRQIRARLGLRARWEKPGTLQRMSIAYISESDALEAHAVGREAIGRALAGETDRMVTLIRESDEPYLCGFSTTDLDRVASRERILPVEFVGDASEGPTDAFRRYATPLLGGPLPTHAKLE